MSYLIQFFTDYKKVFRFFFWLLMIPIFILYFAAAIEFLFQHGQIIGTLVRRVQEVNALCC